MPNETNNQDGWVPTSRLDVGGDLLQRSLEHVERLLERLEYAPAPPAVAEWSRRDDEERADDAQRRTEAAAEGDRLLSQAKRISEQLLAQCRDEADPLARQLIAAATGAAEGIRARAEHDAEDIVSAARARMKRECATAEGRAAERLDAAEHEAHEIRRHAWQIAQAQPDRLVDGNATSTVLITPGTGERELIARAVGTMRNASGALDGLATLMASGSADLASTAATLESLLDLSPEPRGGVRGAAAEELVSCEGRKVNGNTVASGSVATSLIGDRP